MKSSWVLLLAMGLAPVSLSLAQTEPENSPAQNAIKTEFEQAKALHDQARFDEAYAAFEQLWQKASSSWTVNFYLARCALELKRYDNAMAAFDRVLILNPEHTRTRLEMARLYYELGDFQMAQAELDAVLATPLPDTVKNNVLAFKARIDREQNRHTHNVTLVLGGGYDSNANNQIGEDTDFDFYLPEFDLSLPLNGEDAVADYHATQTLVYSHSYDFGQIGGWRLNNQLVGYNKLNKDLSQNNVTFLAASIAPSFSGQNQAWRFPLEFEKIYIEGEDYMSTLGMGLNISRSISQNQSWGATYKFKVLEYAKTNQSLNALSSVYSLNYNQGFLQTWSWGVVGSYEQRQQNIHADIDLASYNESQLKLDLANRLTERWRLGLAASYRKTRYQQANPNFLTIRSDQVLKLDFNTSYVINQSSSINAALSRAVHDSNQQPYEYDKNLITLNYALSF